MPTRRAVLGLVAGACGTVAGCAGSDDGPPPETDVVVGPDSQLAFEPETLTVSVGDAVTWYFASPGHNVSCAPDHHEAVDLPEGATPFASVENPNAVNSQGETYDYTFQTAGEYRYVCVPHAPKMAGTIRVE
jgi:plastocyanin